MNNSTVQVDVRDLGWRSDITLFLHKSKSNFIAMILIAIICVIAYYAYIIPDKKTKIALVVSDVVILFLFAYLVIPHVNLSIFKPKDDRIGRFTGEKAIQRQKMKYELDTVQRIKGVEDNVYGKEYINRIHQLTNEIQQLTHEKEDLLEKLESSKNQSKKQNMSKMTSRMAIAIPYTFQENDEST